MRLNYFPMQINIHQIIKEMKNLPAIFTGTAPSKTEIADQCQVIINEINETGNALKVATTMKAMEIAMKTIKEGISDAIMDEADKYEGKTFDFDGHALSIREAGARYDYSNCGDPYMDDYLEEMKSLKAKIKDREAFLKAIKDKATIVDERTGDVAEVYPPSKTSTTSLTINLKK